jgi:hypothetical protein
MPGFLPGIHGFFRPEAIGSGGSAEAVIRDHVSWN